MPVEKSETTALQKENEELKAALDTLAVRHAELIDERNRPLLRRAALSKKYKELRERLQSKIEQNST